MIKCMNGRGISHSSSVKIRSHPGTTAEDLIDYIRPTARKNPKMMAIHFDTNEITNKVKTFLKIRKVINAIKENDVTESMWASSQLQRQNLTLRFRMHSSYYLAFMSL